MTKMRGLRHLVVIAGQVDAVKDPDIYGPFYDMSNAKKFIREMAKAGEPLPSPVRFCQMTLVDMSDSDIRLCLEDPDDIEETNGSSSERTEEGGGPPDPEDSA